MNGLTREKAIAQLREAGFDYVGPSEITNRLSAELTPTNYAKDSKCTQIAIR